MKKTVVSIQSVSQLHELLGYAKPKHPLITILDYSQFRPNPTHQDIHFALSFYAVSLKTPAPKSLRYGRQYYDFAEGTMMFSAPNQVLSVGEIDDSASYSGWGLYFHPDLIYDCALSSRMKDYAFFSYQAHEALHVSEEEKKLLEQLIWHIQGECQGHVDQYTRQVIVTYIEQVLNYAQRFYGRQFFTRQKSNHDVLAKFERLLQDFFDREMAVNGSPTVEFFSDQLGLSPGYLTELLKHETGKTTKEWILLELLERAKRALLNTHKSINEIAYDLGFEYPQYFNRFFKSRTGLTPMQYRQAN